MPTRYKVTRSNGSFTTAFLGEITLRRWPDLPVRPLIEDPRLWKNEIEAAIWLSYRQRAEPNRSFRIEPVEYHV